MTATWKVSMSWVLWGQLPSLQRAACKIRLLGQGDWRYPWRFSPFTEYCESVISPFFHNHKTMIPNIRYFVTVSWLGINRAWKTMKCSSASQLSIFPGSWNLFPCGLHRCKKCSSHTHLSWNTTCIGTALFLTVFFRDVSDLYLIPQAALSLDTCLIRSRKGKAWQPHCSCCSFSPLRWRRTSSAASTCRICQQERGSSQPQAAPWGGSSVTDSSTKVVLAVVQGWWSLWHSLVSWSGDAAHLMRTKTVVQQPLWDAASYLPHLVFKCFSWLDKVCSRALSAPLSVSDCVGEAPEAIHGSCLRRQGTIIFYFYFRINLHLFSGRCHENILILPYAAMIIKINAK